MNSRFDLRDLLQLWCDDLSSFEETGRISRGLSDSLAAVARSVFCVVESLRPSLAPASSFLRSGSVVHGGESFKPKTPVGEVPKAQKSLKCLADSNRNAGSENKAKTASVKNEPIQLPLPLVWAM